MSEMAQATGNIDHAARTHAVLLSLIHISACLTSVTRSMAYFCPSSKHIDSGFIRPSSAKLTVTSTYCLRLICSFTSIASRFILRHAQYTTILFRQECIIQLNGYAHRIPAFHHAVQLKGKEWFRYAQRTRYCEEV